MNKHDLNNYNFLISASQDQFDSWCKRATPDDFEYALELFKAKRTHDILDTTIDNLDLSKGILKQFTLKG